MGTGPAAEYATLSNWDKEDSMILPWLWNSMTPEDSILILIKFESKSSGKKYYRPLRAEESRQGVMLDNPVNDGSTMNSTKDGHNGKTNRNENQSNREGV
ncbi:hypothetical protein ACLOJK_041268 [Asimina triloba]